jgi:hypothetical protein
MNTFHRKNLIIAAAPFAMAILLTTPAAAQYNGENVLGDYGLKSGSQAPPGFYAGYLFYKYDTHTVRGPNGGSLPGGGNTELNAYAHMLVPTWVLPTKILGANVGGMVAFPWLNTVIDSPRINSTGSYAMSDIYVQPLNLGWHFKRADAIAGYAFTAPTGKFEPGGENNRGKGFWSNELSLGSTIYLDQKKTWHAATTGFYELHTTRKGGDVKVGDILTLEGGVGKTLKQIINVGPVYYAQWKVTVDSGTGVPELFPNNKHRVFGVGPEVNVFLPTKMSGQNVESGLSASVRYLWETGAVMKTEGRSLIISLAYLF